MTALPDASMIVGLAAFVVAASIMPVAAMVVGRRERAESHAAERTPGGDDR